MCCLLYRTRKTELNGDTNFTEFKVHPDTEGPFATNVDLWEKVKMRFRMKTPNEQRDKILTKTERLRK